MRRLLVTLVAAAAAAVVAALGVPLSDVRHGAVAQAAGYTGVTRTSCDVSGVVLRPGAHPGVTVEVRTGNLRPTGRVALTYLHQPSGERWSEEHAYGGGVLRLPSDRLARPGTYRVTVVFEPAPGSIYRSCRDTTSFRYTARALADASGTDEGTHDPTSGHPGTTQTDAHDGATSGDPSGTTADSAAGVQDDDRSGPSLHGLLAATGNPVTLALVVSTLALLVLGASLLRRPASSRRGGRGSRR